MDTELETLNKINEAIKDLSKDAKVRIVAWLINKYSIHSGQQSAIFPQKLSGTNKLNGEEIIEGDIQTIISFTTPADILAKCNTDVDSEKVLIIAAYLQEKNVTKELTGYEINHTLKNVGHKVGNITNCISSLMQKKPQFMIQTKKSGTSQQAKKNYKVTDEGIKEVERLIKN